MCLHLFVRLSDFPYPHRAQHSKHIPATIANPVVLLDELAQRIETRNDPLPASTILPPPPHEYAISMARANVLVKESSVERVPTPAIPSAPMTSVAQPVDVRAIYIQLPIV